MSRNSRRDTLPSYNEVLGGEWRDERAKICLHAARVSFVIVNIFISLIASGGFFVIRFTDTLRVRTTNVTKYCGVSSYSVNPMPELGYFAATVLTVFAFLLCIAVSVIKSGVEKHTTEKKLKQTFWQLWIMGMHVLFLYTLIEFLKCAAGIPRPYFFSSEDLKQFYCENKSKDKNMTLLLEKSDMLRKSFPSYRSAVYTYSITFMYLFLDHFDIENGLHASQQLIVLVLGAYATYNQFHSWDEGENHLSDILVGAALGTIQAMMTIHGMFGSVFYSRTHSSIEKVKTRYIGPSAPPMYYLRRQDFQNQPERNPDFNYLETIRTSAFGPHPSAPIRFHDDTSESGEDVDPDIMNDMLGTPMVNMAATQNQTKDETSETEVEGSSSTSADTSV